MHPGLKGGDFFAKPFASSAGKKVFSVMAGNSQQETMSNINYKKERKFQYWVEKNCFTK